MGRLPLSAAPRQRVLCPDGSGKEIVGQAVSYIAEPLPPRSDNEPETSTPPRSPANFLSLWYLIVVFLVSFRSLCGSSGERRAAVP